MLNLSSAVRVFVAIDPVDLHFSFDRLAGLVRSTLKENPLSGNLFVFFNKRRNKVKIFLFDRSGYAVFYKRLERGNFEVLQGNGGGVEVNATTLTLLLEGIDLDAPRRTRFALSVEPG
jgi:transposase